MYETIQLLSLLACVTTVVADDTLVSTPPMGWRSWNAFQLKIDQDLMLKQVDALLKGRGSTAMEPTLLELGYKEIGIDDGWQACGAGANGSFHTDAGTPIVNTSIFPDMLAMTRQAREKKVLMGWYMNNCWCGETDKVQPGGFPQQDADAAAAFEFDGLKVDGCGPAHDITKWTDAVSKAGRSMAVENCGDNNHIWSPPDPWSLKQCPFQIYRMSMDIAPNYISVMWNLNQMVPYLDKSDPMSRPGCWAYPDMLQVGGNPWGQLTEAESRAHFAAWCVTSSPLILGFDLTNDTLIEELYPIIGNKRAIAVNQAWHGHPGFLARNSEEFTRVGVPHYAGCWCCHNERICRDFWHMPTWQVWAKPLGEGEMAVVMLNHGGKREQVCIHFTELQLSGGLRITDVWTGEEWNPENSTRVALCRNIDPHDAQFVTLKEAEIESLV